MVHVKVDIYEKNIFFLIRKVVFEKFCTRKKRIKMLAA